MDVALKDIWDTPIEDIGRILVSQGIEPTGEPIDRVRTAILYYNGEILVANERFLVAHKNFNTVMLTHNLVEGLALLLTPMLPDLQHLFTIFTVGSYVSNYLTNIYGNDMIIPDILKAAAQGKVLSGELIGYTAVNSIMIFDGIDKQSAMTFFSHYAKEIMTSALGKTSIDVWSVYRLIDDWLLEIPKHIITDPQLTANKAAFTTIAEKVWERLLRYDAVSPWSHGGFDLIKVAPVIPTILNGLVNLDISGMIEPVQCYYIALLADILKDIDHDVAWDKILIKKALPYSDILFEDLMLPIIPGLDIAGGTGTGLSRLIDEYAKIIASPDVVRDRLLELYKVT